MVLVVVVVVVEPAASFERPLKQFISRAGDVCGSGCVH
jgi:hypothetical protein